MHETKTSEEWQELVKEYIFILDPDGWDRSPQGWQKSWHEEKITYDQFMQRVMVSTCEFRWAGHDNLIDMFKEMDTKFGGSQVETGALSVEPQEKRGANMKVVLSPGDVLTVELDQTDGKFEIHYDSNFYPGHLIVSSDLPDEFGREGVLYNENFHSECCPDKRELSPAPEGTILPPWQPENPEN